MIKLQMRSTKLAMIMPSGPLRALTIAFSAFVIVRAAPNILTAIGVGILVSRRRAQRRASRRLKLGRKTLPPTLMTSILG